MSLENSKNSYRDLTYAHINFQKYKIDSKRSRFMSTI